MAHRLQLEDFDVVEYLLPSGDKISVEARGDTIRVRGSGARMGKLSVEPGGANVADIRVIG